MALFTVNYRGQMVDGLLTAGRGEDRWCLNTAAALVGAGHEVLLWGPHVPKNVSAPEGITNHAPQERIDQSIFMTYSPAVKLIHTPPAKFHIYNFYEIPSKIKLPNNSIATQCYEVGQRAGRFRTQFGNNYYHLTHPAVEEVDFERDNFNCKRITWTARYMLQPNGIGPKICERALQWIANKMVKDQELEFVFLTGEKSNVPIHDRLWGHKFMSPLKKFKDRVKLFHEVSWGKVLEILKDTKLIMNTGHYNHTFGGSGLEAASFGIPSVCYNLSPFANMSGKISVSGPNEMEKMFSEMNKLYNNHQHYRESGDRYRNHVHQNFTYSVFIDQLTKILKSRKVLP